MREKEIDRECIEIVRTFAHHETKALTLHASVCERRGENVFFFLSSFPSAMCSFFLFFSFFLTESHGVRPCTTKTATVETCR